MPSWKSSSQFRTVFNELQALEGYDFVQKIQPLLILVQSQVNSESSFETKTVPVEKSGAFVLFGQADDLMLSSSALKQTARNVPGDKSIHSEPLFQLVQCHGFISGNTQVGDAQSLECQRATEIFLQSGLHVQNYVFVYNRREKNSTFRESIESIGNSLVESGRVDTFQIWNLTDLLERLCDVFLSRLSEFAQKYAPSTLAADTIHAYEPLKRVPLSVSTISVDAHSLHSDSEKFVHQGLLDPVEELLKGRITNYSVLLGEFGFGKTTAALRASAQQETPVFFVSGASLNLNEVSSKNLLLQCVNEDALAEEFIDIDQSLLKPLLKVVVEKYFIAEKCHAVLLFDAIDEAPLLNRKGGLQTFFQLLAQVRCRILMTVRSEFWDVHRADFEIAFGSASVSGRGTHNLKHHSLIRLLPWSNVEIARLIKRHRDSLEAEDEKARLQTLLELVEKGQYEQFYGDIPRRPLFLQCILQSVEAQGVQLTGRVRLLDRWCRLKILRDTRNPQRFNSTERIPLSDDITTMEETISLALLVMEKAAHLMTQEKDGEVELLPFCDARELRSIEPQFDRITNSGLVLNSLLLPVSPRLPGTPLRLRFAHRAFQEFFLARFLLNEGYSLNTPLPTTVQEWMEDLRTLNEENFEFSTNKARIVKPMSLTSTLATQNMVTILFLASNPDDGSGGALKLDAECRSIDQRLRASKHRERFDLRSQWAVRVNDLQNALLEYSPTIVHFSGHGNSSGQIILQDDTERSFPVSQQSLSELFQILSQEVRCVVLNACYSEDQARAIADHIDCVVGVPNEIDDTAAISFSAAFYQALGYGCSVQQAFELGCNSIGLSGHDASQSPKLLTRRGVDASKVVLIDN